MKRAIRRAHRERLAKNRRNYWGRDEKSEKELGKLVNTATPCSCWMCQNRREQDGPTIQERRHDQ